MSMCTGQCCTIFCNNLIFFGKKLPNYAFMLSLLRSVVQYSVSNPTSFDRASFWLQEYMMAPGLLCC